MTLLTSNIPILSCDFALALPSTQPLCACSSDYGFDVDVDEISRALLAPLPASLATQPLPEVGADEFERVFLHFLS